MFGFWNKSKNLMKTLHALLWQKLYPNNLNLLCFFFLFTRTRQRNHFQLFEISNIPPIQNMTNIFFLLECERELCILVWRVKKVSTTIQFLEEIRGCIRHRDLRNRQCPRANRKRYYSHSRQPKHLAPEPRSSYVILIFDEFACFLFYVISF